MIADPNAPSTKADLQALREDLERALEPYATKADLDEALAKALEPYVTKDDLATVLEAYPTKEDLARELRDLKLELAGELSRWANVIIEHLTDRFRAGDDRTIAVGERVDRVEERLAAHVADPAVHRAPRKRAR